MKMKEKVVRPVGLELPTFWFVDTQYKTLSASSGVAYRGTRHLSLSWVGPKLDWNGWGEPPKELNLPSPAR